MLTGLDPDQHNGSVEWLIVAVLLAVAVAMGLVARRHWRLLAADGRGGSWGFQMRTWPRRRTSRRAGAAAAAEPGHDQRDARGAARRGPAAVAPPAGYPDRPALRTEFPFRQALSDDGTEEPPQHAAETAVTELYVAAVTDRRADGGSADRTRRRGAPRSRCSRAHRGGLAVDRPGQHRRPDQGHRDRPGQRQPDVGGQRRRRGMAHPGRRRHLGGGRRLPRQPRLLRIAMHPAVPRTIYAGTGEGFWNADAIQGKRNLRDLGRRDLGGASRDQGPGFHLRQSRRGVGSGVVLAATNAGLFRSDDAARATWTRVLSGASRT